MKKNNVKVILFLIVLIFSLVFLLVNQSGLGSSLVILALIYSYFIYKAVKTKKKIHLFLILAFTIRVIFILLDNFYGLVPYNWDTGQFHNTALLIKENMLTFRPFFYNINASSSVKSYSFFVSIIYIIFGSHEITIRIINAFIGVYIAKQAYQITLMAKLNTNSANWLMILIGIWPSFILYTSINMREPLIILLTLDLIKRFFLMNQSKLINSLIFLVDLSFIYYLRKQNIYLFAIIILFYLFAKKFIYSRVKYKIIFLIIFLGAILYLIHSQMLPTLNLNYIISEMELRTRGGSAYLEWMNYSSIIDIIKFIPLRAVYFLFGPFIWDLSVKNIFMLFAFIESFIFLILFILGIKGLFDKKNLYNERLLFLLTFLVIGVAGYASITANYGTAIRHKMTFMIIMFIFISKSFSRYKLKIFK